MTQRLKKQSTILDKLNRLLNMELCQMADIGGVRVVLPTQAAVDDVLRPVRKNWRPHIERVRDYVSTPKSSGYRAKHLIVLKKERRIEVQLRTPLQDTWSNQVEADSRWAANFKAGEGHRAVHDYYVCGVGTLRLPRVRRRTRRTLHARTRPPIRAAKPYLPTEIRS